MEEKAQHAKRLISLATPEEKNSPTTTARLDHPNQRYENKTMNNDDRDNANLERSIVNINSNGTCSIFLKIKLWCHNCYFFVAISFLVIVYSHVSQHGASTAPQHLTSDNFIYIREEIYSLANQFTYQPKTVWINIVAGTKDYYKQPQRPLVILLFIQTTKKDNDNGVTECIAQILATKLIRFLQNNESAKPAILDSNTLERSEFGELFEELKTIVRSNKVLVINNLQELAGSMALSLFALCDRYSPAVNDAVLIFTLHGKSEGHESESAEVTAILQDLWNLHVPQDKLSALVTRVTSRVVTIAPENQLSDLCTQLQSLN